MNIEIQSPSMEGKTKKNAHEIGFFIDGEPYETTKRELTPNEILRDYAHVDPATHHLVQITGSPRESYAGRGDEPIKLHNNMKFQVVSKDPTTVSDPVVRTGVDFFLHGLKALGYKPAQASGKASQVTFGYEVLSGKHTGKKLEIGVDVPPDFPLTPPGGPHISEALHPVQSGGNHPTGGIHQSAFNAAWQYWSRPCPGWAQGKKTVGAYMSHIDRLLATQ